MGIKLVSLRETCGACPSAWTGRTDDGKEFSARYRWGSLSWKLDGEVVGYKSYGCSMDGVMDMDTMFRLTGAEIATGCTFSSIYDDIEEMFNRAKHL